jgi:uncharacterized membrane protein YfcA
MNPFGNLYDIHANLAGPWLLVALTGLGLAVGVVTGLFGVGGAFLITPMLKHVLGIDYTLAVGSSLSFTLGSSSGGFVRHLRLRNVAPKTMLILGGSAVCGTVLGVDLHEWLRTLFAASFDRIMDGTFIGLLLLVAGLVWFAPAHGRRGRCPLQRLPVGPKITIYAAHRRHVSLPGLCGIGLGIGIVTGLLGIGGGVLFMPVLLLVVGLTMHRSVGTSLGVVLFGALVGAILYGARGEANLWIVMPLLVGSGIGIQLGTWLCQRLHATHLRRWFAVLVCAVAAYIAITFVVNLARGG